MAGKKNSEKANETLDITPKNEVTENANNLPAHKFDQSAFDLLEKFEGAKNEQLKELTSEVLKMGEGEVRNFIITNEITEMEGDEGKTYEAITMYDKLGQKFLCSDTIVLNKFKDFFESNDATHVLARLSCKGMRKSQKDSKREYRDISIHILS